ncbi:MAG: hypothetical protein GXP25_16415 [Planctomycetes bacterium]|nr:hypothetical protein [Planctomycetota bacterium]
MGSKKLGANWTDFCWQGLELEVPADWELGAASGHHESGYIRLDDPDMVRLEMRWEKAKGKVTAKEVVDNHIKEAQKEVKRSKQSFKTKRDLSLVDLEGIDHECFSFDAEFQSFGMVRRCGECKRNTFVRVMYRKGDPIRPVVKRIFESLSDHPAGDGVKWRFFDFAFDSPASMTLKERTLKTGCLEMLFVRRKDEVEYARVSLASLQMKKKKLKEWFEEFYNKRLRAYRCSSQEEIFRGHKSLVYTGEARLLRPVTTLFRIRRDLWARVWWCEDSDKLFVFRVTAKTKQTPDYAKFVETIRCH